METDGERECHCGHVEDEHDKTHACTVEDCSCVCTVEDCHCIYFEENLD